MRIIIVVMHIIMRIIVVMHNIVLMHIDEYFFNCYDAYAYAYYCCYAYYCFDAY